VKWCIVDKKQAEAPSSGNYRKWKPLLAREAGLQCVYCCIHESRFGGMRNFHVEHYKPQSLFPELTNVYDNLFYACGICNVFKSDDWPTEHTAGDYSVPAYPCPALVDYSDFLHVDDSTGVASSKTITGCYVLERLHLNRGQLVALRVQTALFARIGRAHDDFRKLLDSGSIPAEQKDAVIDLLLRLQTMTVRYVNARPYSADQLRA
jgi:hypothetical protein